MTYSTLKLRRAAIRSISGILLLPIMVMMHSCKKGELDEATLVTSIHIQLKVTDPDHQYKIFLDGEAWEDTLRSEDRVSKLVVLKQQPQHLEVRMLNGDVFFDTTMILPTPQLSFFLYELNAGDAPLVLSGQDDEPAPGTDSVKWRFIYADKNLPGAIKLRYYYVDAATLTAEPFDSVIIEKGEMSRYTTATLKKYSNNPQDAYWGMVIENAATGEIIQKLDLDPGSPRFMEGLLFEINTSFGLLNKKQTQLLDFGKSNYGGVADTYYGRFLIGSD